MRAFSELFAILLIGLFVGGSLAWLSIQNNHGFGTLNIGQWTAWPLAGNVNADPYSKAKVAAGGDVPLGAAEGLAFHARIDRRGNVLRRNCQYQLTGLTPPARLWTLTAHDMENRVLFKSDGRPSQLLSRQLLRGSDGRFRIVAGPDLSAENWLEVDGTGQYQLILRLYDSPITSTGSVNDAEMPSVSLVECDT
ncbi:MAG: DUF1214 domain-containing protein [Rhizobiaceae bacterium]